MTIPDSIDITEIIIEDRQRKEYGDVPNLAANIKDVGLAQPIVLSLLNDGRFRLTAGGRRVAALRHAGYTHVFHGATCDPLRPGFVLSAELPLDKLYELELVENTKRLDMSWQERCLNIAKIHSLKRLRAAEDADKWGMAETAELLGSSKTQVHYALTIAKELSRDPKGPLWSEPTMADAWKLIMRDEQDALQEELRRREAASLASPPEQFILPSVADYAGVSDLPYPAAVDLARDEAKERYLRNPLNNPAGFDAYYAEKSKADDERRNTVSLSNRLVHGDSIDFMHAHTASFDHIITDIPYGIDLDMLEQQNPHGGMVDIDTVRAEHDVDENKALMARFFPAAFGALKDAGFLVTWCDIMNWQYMYDLAIAAGFKVQRWPITWNKTHRCMNQCAQYNFTKNTEIALVCRKGLAVLMQPAPTCVVTASNEEMRREIDHPFAKPFECWQFIADHVSFRGQTILEPFAGRGSGVISLMRLQRNVIACEINDTHYNALVENVKKHYLRINPNFRFV